jgi:hypothetical protein
MADFGYDVSEYCGVDPTFGALTDFDDLVTAAHNVGIKVIIDFTIPPISIPGSSKAGDRASIPSVIGTSGMIQSRTVRLQTTG